MSDEEIFDIIGQIEDPEIPVLTISDLGIVRAISQQNGRIVVTITPTYTGCPAMNQIEDDILLKLQDLGFKDSKVITIFDPPWTTDWLTDEAKLKLQQYGIAPPEEKTSDKNYIAGNVLRNITCPQCKSNDTKLVSQFGSTACKSLYQCSNCKEPFDYFKCL